MLILSEESENDVVLSARSLNLNTAQVQIFWSSLMPT